MLIHCGDLTNKGELNQVEDFNDWIKQFPHSCKLVTCGNHDFCFQDQNSYYTRNLLQDCIYLEGTEYVFNGVKFWGHAATPWFHSWAFNFRRGAEIKKIWDRIPDNVNCLITHGPAHMIHDLCPSGDHAGCEDLLQRISELKQLKLHTCDHIHNGYSYQTINGIHRVNCSICDEKYRPINAPIVVDI